jgi:hypothetical protein
MWATTLAAIAADLRDAGVPAEEAWEMAAAQLRGTPPPPSRKERHQRSPWVEVDGERCRLADLARANGVRPATAARRVRQGAPIAEAIRGGDRRKPAADRTVVQVPLTFAERAALQQAVEHHARREATVGRLVRRILMGDPPVRCVTDDGPTIKVPVSLPRSRHLELLDRARRRGIPLQALTRELLFHR